MHNRSVLNHQDHCPVLELPVRWNCSENFIHRVQNTTAEIFTTGGSIVMSQVPFMVLNNALAFLVFQQSKYKNKLLPNIIKFIYTSNLFYIAVLLSLAINDLTAPDPSPTIDFMCGVFHFTLNSVRATQIWIFSLVATIQTITLIVPFRCVEFRINARNAWPVFSISGAVSYFSNVIYLTRGQTIMCRVNEIMPCMSQNPEIWQVLITFLIPLSLCVACCVVIVIKNCVDHKERKQRCKSFIEVTRQQLNRILLVITAMIALTGIPSHLMQIVYHIMDIEPCSDEYFEWLTFSFSFKYCFSSVFGYDALLFFIISPPFRRDLVQILKKPFLPCLGSADKRKKSSLNTTRTSLV